MPSNKLDNKTVFVTGGTGTIGSQVVHNLLTEGAKVIVFSRDQNKQFKMDYDISSSRVTYRNGDICDYQILRRAVNGAELIVHCAASKHVPLCERNADSAIKVNVDGTRNVLIAAQEHAVKKVLFISTDKSVNPESVMGATKFLSEKLCLEFNSVLPCSVVRLGNVFASNGSVVPTFLDRIKNRLPLIVNDPVAIRYFITQKEAGNFIVDRLKDMTGGEIFIKRMKFMTIQQLAEAMAPEPGYPIKTGKLSPGEKRKENLLTQSEAAIAREMDDYYIVANGQEIKRKLSTSIVQQFTHDEIQQMLRHL